MACRCWRLTATTLAATTATAMPTTLSASPLALAPRRCLHTAAPLLSAASAGVTAISTTAAHVPPSAAPLPLVGIVHDGSTAGAARALDLSARFGLPLVPSPSHAQFAVSVVGAATEAGSSSSSAAASSSAHSREPASGRSWASAPPPPTPSSLCLLDPGGRVFTRPFDLVAYTTEQVQRRDSDAGLYRALGRCRVVLDATGGCGVDALTLATLGVAVHVVERNPAVGLLLEDCVARWNQVYAGTGHPTRHPVQFSLGDAGRVMAGLAAHQRPEAVVIDVMYGAQGSAKGKRHAQVLQALTQGDSSAGDGSELLGAALQVARDRVVVKRGKRLQPLVPLGVATPAQARPTYSVSGTTTRFDVYLTGAGPGR